MHLDHLVAVGQASCDCEDVMFATFFVCGVIPHLCRVLVGKDCFRDRERKLLDARPEILHCKVDETARARDSDGRLQVVWSVGHLWEGFDVVHPLEQHFIIFSLTISVKVACVQPTQLASSYECGESEKEAPFSGMLYRRKLVRPFLRNLMSRATKTIGVEGRGNVHTFKVLHNIVVLVQFEDTKILQLL